MNAARGSICALLALVSQWIYIAFLFDEIPGWVCGIPAVLVYYIASGARMPRINWRKTMAQAKEKATNQPYFSDTIELDVPIQLDSITLRKPTAGELRGVNLSDVLQLQTDALIKLIPRLSNPSLTEHEVRNMDPADLVQCGGEIAGFLLTKRAKGEAA